MLSILVGHHLWLDRPDDPEGGIVPTDPGLMLWRVELRYLIEGLGCRFQCDVTMSEVFRDVQHAPVFGRQIDAEPPLVGGGFRSQVNDYIPDGAARAAYELDLGMGRLLIVETADGSDSVVKGRIALHDSGVEALLFKFVLTPGAGKKPPTVLS